MNLVGALFPVGKIARATTLVSFEVAEKTRTWKEERKAKKLAASLAQPTGGCEVSSTQAHQQPQYTHQPQEPQQPYQYPPPGQYAYPPPGQYTYPPHQAYAQPAHAQPAHTQLAHAQPAQYYPPQAVSPPQHTPTPPPAYSQQSPVLYGGSQKTNYDVYQPRPYDA